MEDCYQEKVARVMRRGHVKIQFSAGFTPDHLLRPCMHAEYPLSGGIRKIPT